MTSNNNIAVVVLLSGTTMHCGGRMLKFSREGESLGYSKTAAVSPVKDSV